MSLIITEEIRQLLVETMGIRYWPLASSGTKTKAPAQAALQPPHGVAPELIFLFLDSQDLVWTAHHETVFSNLVKAMGLKVHQVWKTPVVDLTIVDFLSKLRSWELTAPLVVMSPKPLITESASQMGPHSWIEIHSVSAMIKNPEVKKMSWKLLQLFKKDTV